MIKNRRMHAPRHISGLMIAILAFSALAAMSQMSWAVSAHDYTLEKINGQALPLKQFRGRPILLVNTASQCGFTPQYKSLQALWERYQEHGLVVVGVPSNDFGRQEPDSAQQIQQFCDLNDGVNFTLTAKQRVVGREAHPLYHWIVSELGAQHAPRWNFHKYLISPDGQVVGKLLPEFAARLAFGEMADALFLSSSRVKPQRLVESSYAFRFPELGGALQHLLGKSASS